MSKTMPPTMAVPIRRTCPLVIAAGRFTVQTPSGRAAVRRVSRSALQASGSATDPAEIGSG
jgi:hypothetical protein